MAAKQTYAFGSGSVICLAGGIATKIGTLQEISVDFSSTNVMLQGQNQFPDAIARGEGKIQGKAKTGTLDLQLFSSIYLGQAIDTTGYTKLIEREAKTIPASSTYTVTAANTLITDLGVYYADGSGLPDLSICDLAVRDIGFCADLGEVDAGVRNRAKLLDQSV